MKREGRVGWLLLRTFGRHLQSRLPDVTKPLAAFPIHLACHALQLGDDAGFLSVSAFIIGSHARAFRG